MRQNIKTITETIFAKILPIGVSLLLGLLIYLLGKIAWLGNKGVSVNYVVGIA